MRKVASVKFRTSQRSYYFEPAGIELKSGDMVIAETVRGLEIGCVRGEIKEVPESEFGGNIKKIVRKATEADLERDRQNLERKKEAIPVCKDRIARFGLEMKLIDAEYTFDGSKLVFYFTADKRIDFRELVRELADYFHIRIELRQVGARDETRLLGGYGVCGRPLCCAGWLQEFAPVSIKMAKVQNLPLNPTKISGSCGRLMCCLKYETDVYQELKKGMPNTGEYVTAPIGKAKVVEASIFKGSVKVRKVEAARQGEEPEKLSDEVFEYTKDEVKRQGKPNESNVDAQNKNKGRVKGKGRGGKNAPQIAAQEESYDREIARAIENELVSVDDE